MARRERGRAVTDMLDRADDTADGADATGADAFRVLGLPYSPELTDADVRGAYLLRLRAAHPENGGSTEAAAAVTAAYDALRSGVRRGELLAALTMDRGDAAPPSGGARRRRASRRPTGRGSGTGPGRLPDAERRAELRARVAASRAAQGLPPYITDEATLAKIADLMVVMLGRGEGGAGTPRSAGAAWPWEDAGREPPTRPAEPSSWRRDRRRWRADQRERVRAGQARPVAAGLPGSVWWQAWAPVRHGRPGWLAARVTVAAMVPLVAQVAAPGNPAVPALAVGALTWLLLTAQLDLGPRAPR